MERDGRSTGRLRPPLPLHHDHDAASRCRRSAAAAWKRALRRPDRLLWLVIGVSLSSVAVLLLWAQRPRWRCVATEDHVDERFFDASRCVTQAQRHARLVELVRAMSVLLESAQIDYWLDSGTLLGQFRDRTVIAWDTDADFGITSAGYATLRDTIEPLPVPAGYELQILESLRYGGGGDDDTYARDLHIPVRLVDTTFGFYVDVFVFEESVVGGVAVLSVEPSSSWNACAHCLRVDTHRAWLVIPKSYVFPLLACDFADFRVLCPAQRTRYLEHLYGRDFRVPQHP
ncbi:hypothetical protein P43SY_002408 [Pythium insidiosum]|uniref:LicD/FKTN/FKRP nucleotidyltransferase domain-containing protein n=1 Tax=Pythium insidiosum TaxID=114742 RepID=A0AAD5LE98_PYTIN|nr:hypothetical protein P43SY_002408 [Pythium insidiosum]